MEFKDVLRELRSQKGLTQEELGKQFNVIKQTISSWENGNSRPDIEMASRLADFFGVSTGYLLGRETDNPRPRPTQEEKDEIMEMFKSLPLEEKKAFLKKILNWLIVKSN